MIILNSLNDQVDQKGKKNKPLGQRRQNSDARFTGHDLQEKKDQRNTKQRNGNQIHWTPFSNVRACDRFSSDRPLPNMRASSSIRSLFSSKRMVMALFPCLADFS